MVFELGARDEQFSATLPIFVRSGHTARSASIGSAAPVPTQNERAVFGMKHFACALLAGTMMSGTVAFGSFAYAESAPFVLAQAEVPPPPPAAEGGAPPEDPRKKRQEQQQQRQQQRQQQQEQRQDKRQEKQQQRQEQQQDRKEQRQRQIEQRQQQRQAPPPAEKAPPAPPPAEKAPPPPAAEKAPPSPAPEKAPPPPPPAEKQAAPPAAAPRPSEKSDERQQQRQERIQERQQQQQERQQQRRDGATPPIPPVPPRTQAPAAPDTAAPPPPARPAAPAAGNQAPPPASSQTAPAAPSVAPAPPPAGEQPAIPPEELKRGQRTPEQRERAKQRVEREFKQRDQSLDRRFNRRVEEQGDRTIIREGDNRVIIRDGDRTIIRSNENERLRRNARDVREERRGNQRVTVIRRPDGSEIVTILDDDGNLIRRVRRVGGREVVLIDNQRAWERGGRWDRDRGWRDRDRDRTHFEFFLDLPPVVVNIPREEYIIDADDASYDDFEEAFDAPPLVESERPYSLQEVTQNVRLRERVRSVDLNSITFPTGEWTVPDDQIAQLEDLARAMKAVIDRDPTEVYLIEGHTDAVGSQVDNLSLSDRRAEEVAAILTEHFEIPAENLVTQGYGEDYLKVNTLAANEENRRVTVRNITPLLNTQQSQAAPQ
jgi:outer membrane protein OmpA-like peptidoglycan-associated protein